MEDESASTPKVKLLDDFCINNLLDPKLYIFIDKIDTLPLHFTKPWKYKMKEKQWKLYKMSVKKTYKITYIEYPYLSNSLVSYASTMMIANDYISKTTKQIISMITKSSRVSFYLLWTCIFKLNLNDIMIKISAHTWNIRVMIPRKSKYLLYAFRTVYFFFVGITNNLMSGADRTDKLRGMKLIIWEITNGWE